MLKALLETRTLMQLAFQKNEDLIEMYNEVERLRALLTPPPPTTVGDADYSRDM